MRILCISAQKPDSTGSGVYLAETVASMAAAGHQVAVIAGIDKDDSPQLAPGVEFFPVRFRTPELPFPVCGMSDVMPYEATRYRDMTPEMVQAFRSAFGQRIRQAVLDFKPEAIICHHLYLACSTACDVLDELAGENRLPDANGEAAGRKGRPCPIWAVCHSTDLRQLRNHDLEKDRIMAAVRSLDGVMALHKAQKAEIAELFDLPADRIHVVGTGYNSQEFAPRGGLRAARPLRVLYVGKICRAKGVESLIRAMDLLPLDPQAVELCLVGGYSDQVQYDRIVKLAGGCRFPVVFGGRVSQDDLVLSYNRSHVFVLPSFFEGLPLVTVEALASGCRAVVTSLPGVRPWLDASLADAPVSFVEPPRIEGVDVPAPEDLPAFEQRLSEALREQLEAAAASPLEGTGFDATAVSWGSLAARMAALVG
ncbi:glycosyltransferase family 4 protein [uncultured Senegalimassilia sp.]|uniref:glycosyltransferase family 4 protein n=1 Tax=uncultured Senegalimassilia sp. TaxID=1714350 RepID=UPI0025E8C055|nr:glycosyltransferase family 4 protein [uncultured Senegalimassilia sp.]